MGLFHEATKSRPAPVGIATLMTLIVAMTTLVSGLSGCSSGEVVFDKLRATMVEEQIIERGISDAKVIESMIAVPRHMFVLEDYRITAYIDSPLPIGSGQTISQPYMVALMTESLRLSEGARVLEIGTGSGYQAAVLSLIADSVFTIEILPALAERSAALLDSLGYDNVEVRAGDGYYGWASKAPFDGIIVTAAAPALPPRLIEQLREGGRLVIPVGRFPQRLEVYIKNVNGMEKMTSTPVRFVPMTGRINEEKGR